MNLTKYVTLKNSVCFVFFVICLCLLGQISFCLIRNSDDSVNAFIGRSMAADGFGLVKWILCTSSFYFTDLIFHGFVAIFTSDARTILTISSFFIVIPLFWCSYKIYEKVAPPPGLSLWLFVFVFAIMLHGFGYHFFKSPNHTGTVSFCLIALLAFYNDKLKYKMLSGIIFVLFAAMAIDSDKYALFYLVLPLLSQTVIDLLQNKKINYKISLLVPVAVLMVLYHLIVKYQVPGIGIQYFVKAENLTSNIYYFFFGFFKLFDAWVWGEPIKATLLPKLVNCMLLFCILSSYFLAIYKFKFTNKWVNFLVLSSFFVSCGYVFGSRVNQFSTVHYIKPVVLNGTILFAILLSAIQVKYRTVLSVICGVATLGILFNDAILQTRKYNNFVKNHPAVKLLEQQGVRAAYANFWDSYSNAVLQTDINVWPIKNRNGRIFLHLWLSPRVTPDEVNAVLLGPIAYYGIDLESVKKFFGEPKDIVLLGQYKLLKYDYNLADKVDERVFYGTELPHRIKVIENNDKSVTNQNVGEKGFITFGPYISKPKGSYEIVVNYELSDDGKAWFDVVADKGKKSFVKKDLLSENNQISETLVFDKDVNALEIRTYYQGSGYLTVKSIEVEEK